MASNECERVESVREYLREMKRVRRHYGNVAPLWHSWVYGGARRSGLEKERKAWRKQGVSK